MTIDEITEKIIESKNNDIAKAFTMHIGSLLLNNGIVPIMTGYTRNDVKNITDPDEYKLVMEYAIAFKELDCSKHDKEIYNKAIDDFVNRISEYLGVENATKYGNKNAEQQRMSYDTLMKYEIADAIEDVAEQLKAGV